VESSGHHSSDKTRSPFGLFRFLTDFRRRQAAMAHTKPWVRLWPLAASLPGVSRRHRRGPKRPPRSPYTPRPTEEARKDRGRFRCRRHANRSFPPSQRRRSVIPVSGPSTCRPCGPPLRTQPHTDTHHGGTMGGRSSTNSSSHTRSLTEPCEPQR
jgi:hypothetical protein